jgi:hypothetical protein
VVVVGAAGVVAVVAVVVAGAGTVAMMRLRTRAIPVDSAAFWLEVSFGASRRTASPTADRASSAPARSPRAASEATAASWDWSWPALEELSPVLWADEPQPTASEAARPTVARQASGVRIGQMMHFRAVPCLTAGWPAVIGAGVRIDYGRR